MPQVVDLIAHAANRNPTKFSDTFNDLMAAKMLDVLADKRAEVAKTYFDPRQSEENE